MYFVNVFHTILEKMICIVKTNVADPIFIGSKSASRSQDRCLERLHIGTFNFERKKISYARLKRVHPT